MKNRGLFYIGLMVLLLGILFLIVNVGSWLLSAREIDVSIARLWPLLIIWVSLAFFLPIFLWWENRQRIYGLAMPGAIMLFTGLVFLYSSLTRDWGAWAYLWTLIPFSVGVGLLLLYLLGRRVPALLWAGLGIGGVSLMLFAILVSILGGQAGGIIGAILLLTLGLILLLRSLIPVRR